MPGGCASGLVFGYLTSETPPDVEPETAFRQLIARAFDGVPGFRFGLVIGRRSRT